MTSPSSVIVFDRKAYRNNRNRTAKKFHNYSFLHDRAVAGLRDRLSDIQRNFSAPLYIGIRSNNDENAPPYNGVYLDPASRISKIASGEMRIQADEDMLPFGRNTFDLIMAAMTLHWVNDLPGALIQMRQSLKNDGAFLGCLLGGETLFELRDCLATAEMELRGGYTPRVSPFTDKQDMGALMQRTGFSLPVVDSDILTVGYRDIFHLMSDLRGMGETHITVSRNKSFTPRALFFRAGELYAQKYAAPDGRIDATFEFIYCIGWGPDESQQKPLQPGSATSRLADFLNTEETTLKD